MSEEPDSPDVPIAEPVPPARVAPLAVIAGALRFGTLLRLLLAFLLWFATACIPYVNIGTTIGLVSTIADIGRGRPVSPIEVFDERHRARIVPFCLTLGLSVAALAGVSIFAWLCAAQCDALLAALPGPLSAVSPSLRRIVFLFAFLPAPLIVGATISFALPIYLDTGVRGLRALAESRRLVEGNLAAVLCVELLPAIASLLLLLAMQSAGFSVLSVAIAEAVLFVFSLALLGRLYGALRAPDAECATM